MADSSLTPVDDKEVVADEMVGTEAPLLEHLIELRKRLIISLLAVGVLFIGFFFVADALFNFLLGPFKAAAGNIEDVRLIYTAPQEYFFTQLSVALFFAVALAFPFLAVQIYAFVAPGLYKKERRAFLPYLGATPVLFLTGAALVYYVVMPLAMRFFLSMEVSGPDSVSIQMETRVSEYLGLVMTLLMAFGICFQLPIVLTLLAQIELITAKQLKSWRKYAVVAVLIVAAFLTPPDPISQIGLALPMLLLYELSILSVILVERRRSRNKDTTAE